MKKHAMGLLEYYFKEKLMLDNLNDFNGLYQEYQTENNYGTYSIA